MPKLSADEIITQKHIRNFLQYGGPSPANPASYAGQDAQYMKIEGVTSPDGSGKIDPIWMHSPKGAPGKFRLVGRKVSAPDLAEATLVMTEKHGAVPRQIQKINCAFNIYENIGDCKDLSDFLGGWSDYVLVYELALIDGNKDHGDRSAWGESDDQVEDSLPLKLADFYPVGALSFGDNTADITLEVMDVVYGSSEQCGDCGPEDDGTKRIYAITKSSGATPGTAGKLYYSTNGGSTWTLALIDTMGQTENAVAIDIVGGYLVIATQIAGGPTLSGYYYSTINKMTGVPGTWTKVTSGFVATFLVNDMFVLSPREVFFVADGGYIYKSTDITAGVEVVSAASVTSASLKRISGDGEETLVAVGASGLVVVSHNRGKTFYTSTASPLVVTLQAVAVLDDGLWWVGSTGGRLYFTLNGGESWTEKGFSGSGAGQIRDIIFATPSVGYFSHDTATPTGRIFTTWDGGRDWTNAAPRINNLPVVNRFNRFDVPRVSAGIAVNNLVAGGLAGDGVDGTLLLGQVSRL